MLSADSIKSAYRKAAMKWHPDRNPEYKARSRGMFRQATEAYSVLSDPQKRALYDRYGHAGLAGGRFDGGGFNATIFDDFHDIFGDLFGMGRSHWRAADAGRRRASARGQRGSDLRYDLSLTFEEAATGVKHKDQSLPP